MYKNNLHLPQKMEKTGKDVKSLVRNYEEKRTVYALLYLFD